MAITCPQCTNTNPAGAKYCFFDGVSLSSAAQEGPVDPGSRPFPHPFVFSSGGQCENFDQLALRCHKEWDAAKDLLKTGVLESFLGGMGRADLAMAAKEAAAFPDLDRGLDQLISRLPSQAVPQAKLQIEPREIRLDPRPVGTDGSFTVKVRNLGTRLLYGSVSADCAWLQPGDLADNGPKLFQFPQSGELTVSVRGKDLRAGSSALEGKLIVESSGGDAVIAVKVEVPVVPFPEGTLAGAITPRQLAEKAKKTPKEAVPLFQNGSVAGWYKSNGWAYPVPGPCASGLGAVQQYFEALGLTKPPRLQLKETEIKLTAAPGASLRHILQVTTPDSKPIFVHATSDQPWLSVGKAQVKGATASLALDVRQVPDQPGRLLSARVVVVGNGNQRFDVPVSLQVEGVAVEPTVLELAEQRKPAQARAGEVRPSRRSGAKPATVELAEAAASTATGQAEHDTAVARQKTRPIVSAGSSGPDNPFADLGETAVVSAPRRGGKAQNVFAVEPDEDSGKGIIVPRRPGARGKQKEPIGSVGFFLHSLPLGFLLLGLSAILLADMFGRHTGFVETVEEKKVEKGEPQFKFEVGGEVVESAMYAPPKIEDEPEENLNKSGKIEHKIKDGPALGADGIPIDPEPLVRFNLNPDASEVEPKTLTSFGIVTTPASGSVKKLTYAEDGSTNSTVVMIDGKIMKFGNSDPGNNAYRFFVIGPRAKKPLFSEENWGVNCDKDGKGGLRFKEILEVVPGGQPVKVNGEMRRQFNTVLVRYYVYNLDKVAHKVGLRLQLDTFIGANDGVPFAVPGRPGLIEDCIDFKEPKDVPDFLQALEVPDVRRPETVAHLTLKGVRGNVEPPNRVSITKWPGNDNQSWEVPVVPMKDKGEAKGDSAVVLYWNEQEILPNTVRRIGFAYGLGTVSAANQDADGNLGLTLAGSFEPGKAFTIAAYVKNPLAKQTLTLDLPPGLRLVGGDKVTKLAAGKKMAVVTWKAEVEKAGEYKISVKSNPGPTMTKIVTIAGKQEAIAAGKFTMELDGNFELGQTFEIIANVTDPVPGQTLKLEVERDKRQRQLKDPDLPPGLEILDPPALRAVPSFPKAGVVRWKVKLIDPDKYQIRIVSSTGVTQTKTLTVYRPVAPGSSFKVELDGTFAPGKSFDVTATVLQPVANQTMELKLPAGLESAQPLLKTVAVPNSAAQWTVKVLKPGTYPVRVVSSTGVAVTKTLTISPPQDDAGEGGGTFNMELVDDIAPGKEFRVVATVKQPVKGQKLNLVLPGGIKLLDVASTVLVPAKDRTGHSTVTWRVRLDGAGRLPVKIESSTGQSKTRVINMQIF